MTGQVSDSIIINGEEYRIAGVKGEGLFNPFNLGLRPVSPNTACRRGHISCYEIRERWLLLQNLMIWLASPEAGDAIVSKWPPLINGIKPLSYTNRPRAVKDFVYNDLRLGVKYSGGILAATGFLSDLYVHMGFHPAWKYEKVIELFIDNGRVTMTRDVSDRMTQLRERLAREPLAPGPGAGRMEIEEWVSSTFRLNY